MIYEVTDISNISNEVVAMMSAYIPALISVFAVLFALWFFRKLFREWTGY